MRSAENPTPTWFRFQQLDSASGETATSSSQGRPTRIQFLQIPSQTTDLPEIPQEPPALQQAAPSSQATSTVDAIPTVPSSKSRIEILLQDNPGHPEEVPKEFHPQDLDYKNDTSCTDILISQREMLRYGSE